MAGISLVIHRRLVIAITIVIAVITVKTFTLIAPFPTFTASFARLAKFILCTAAIRLTFY